MLLHNLKNDWQWWCDVETVVFVLLTGRSNWLIELALRMPECYVVNMTETVLQKWFFVVLGLWYKPHPSPLRELRWPDVFNKFVAPCFILRPSNEGGPGMSIMSTSRQRKTKWHLGRYAPYYKNYETQWSILSAATRWDRLKTAGLRVAFANCLNVVHYLVNPQLYLTTVFQQFQVFTVSSQALKRASLSYSRRIRHKLN